MTGQTDTQKNPLTLYNSLTRKKEQFVPQDPKRVTMYNCGPTVYSYAHIGNARAAVVADVLFRVLRHIYGEDHVVYARNITDVDDKIIAAAKDQGVPISEITEKYAKIYNDDLAAIGCLTPTVQPKATNHIQEMADIIVTLLDKDIAYEGDGHILFDVTKKDDYGRLSGRKLDDNLAGARVEVAKYKRNPADFVLWKPAKNNEPGWSQQNPEENYFVNWRHYGNRAFATQAGRPGWHIECSAMAKATLGETIDIHCGGIDLKFPHHENEIAQSECANEQPFAKTWVHNEFLNMGSDKMSKSLGNVTLIHDLLRDWDGEVIRLALLKAHYRSELSWSEDLLLESKENLDGWYRALLNVGGFSKNLGDARIVMEERKHFFDDLSYMDLIGHISGEIAILRAHTANDDEKFNTDDTSTIERFRRYRTGKVSSALDQITLAGNLLGLLQKDPEDWFKGGLDYDALVAEYDDVRAQALAAKEAGDKAVMGQMFKRSDEIREQFKTEGVAIESGPDGKSSWRKA